MAFLKKEWRTLIIAIFLFAMTYLLVTIKGQVADLQREDAQLRSTIDSVESVTIGTDGNIAEIAKKIDGINSNLEFVVTKVRRR